MGIFKYPRMGSNFKPTHAMRVLFHGRPTRTDIITVLSKRVEHVNIEEIDTVLPPLDNSEDETNYVKSFVLTTKVLF